MENSSRSEQEGGSADGMFRAGPQVSAAPGQKRERFAAARGEAVSDSEQKCGPRRPEALASGAGSMLHRNTAGHIAARTQGPAVFAGGGAECL